MQELQAEVMGLVSDRRKARDSSAGSASDAAGGGEVEVEGGGGGDAPLGVFTTAVGARGRASEGDWASSLLSLPTLLLAAALAAVLGVAVGPTT